MDESIEIRNTLQNQSVLFVDASIKDEQGQYAIVKEKELYYLSEVYKAEPKQLKIGVLEFLAIYKAEKIKEANEHLKDYPVYSDSREAVNATLTIEGQQQLYKQAIALDISEDKALNELYRKVTEGLAYFVWKEFNADVRYWDQRKYGVNPGHVRD